MRDLTGTTLAASRWAEWLECDGLGGFAMGTVCGARTRRYHGLLVAATEPPASRMVMVSGFDAWLQRGSERIDLTCQEYAPGVLAPDGFERVIRFAPEPWPRWVYRGFDGAELAHELFMPHGKSSCVALWRVSSGDPAGCRLMMRPFVMGRDFHGTHRENGAFQFATDPIGPQAWRARPYAGVPAMRIRANARFTPEPLWYRNFLLRVERERGLDPIEDAAALGIWEWDLSDGPAVWMVECEWGSGAEAEAVDEAAAWGVTQGLMDAERRRREGLGESLDRAADAFLVRRGSGSTVIAGYPWFGDWGRDTFIALRGLCLATGRFEEAGAILREWARHVDRGMIPNRFPDRGAEPEFNAVDAALWFVVAVQAWWDAAGDVETAHDLLRDAILAIVEGFVQGTRFGIRVDADGLVAAGEAGAQLTWLDAKVNGRPVTPRWGKPVEIQALWLNALSVAERFEARWTELREQGIRSFEARFWNEAAGCLYDVVDCQGEPGRVDPAVRPNQIFAIGGLPRAILAGDRARSVVDAVERHLLTPLGLRSLSPDDPAYCPVYRGGVAERDAAYHQGTVWPWLAGPFVEAWVRVRGGGPAVRHEARDRFLGPLWAHRAEAGLGHISEIVDGTAPHRARGCPFQAWSLAELIRLDRNVLAV